MISDVAFAIAAICYGVATGVGVSLRGGLVVPTAAALAPTVAAIGLAGELPWSVIVLGPVAITLVAQLAWRSSAAAAAGHTILYLASSSTLIALQADVSEARTAALTIAVAVTLMYSVGEALRQKAWRIIQLGGAEIRTWLLLQGVLVSASGLTILVVDELGATPVVPMLLVLVLTKREFEDLARSRLALDQTVKSLERLSELAAND